MKHALWLALMLAACAKSPRAMYLNDLDASTDHVVVHRGFGTALRMRATYLSSSFRGRLADERARLVGVTSADDAAFRERLAQDAEAYHEIVFTAESGLSDAIVAFGDADDRWQLRLEADGDEQDLVTVFKVRPASDLQQSLYAHKNVWNDLWIARFARDHEPTKELVLHVGGGWGHGELVWSGDALR